MVDDVKILDTLRKVGEISQSELRSLLGMDYYLLKRALFDLEKKGSVVFRMKGSRNKYWSVKK